MLVPAARREPTTTRCKSLWSRRAIATSTILLVRHAAHGHLGEVLSGRTPGIPLSLEGQGQAQALASRLSSEPIAAVQTSPVQRARETAAAIAAASGVQPCVMEALDEIDFGDWTGRRFDDLQGDPQWARWNAERSQAVPPRGETMAAAQRRALDHLRGTARQFAGATLVMVSHCDVIRAVVAGVLGLSLDAVLRFDVDPASLTRLAVGEWGERVISVNEQIASSGG